MDDTLPKVNKRGLLDRPHPIRTRGDVNRARVLPQVDTGEDLRTMNMAKAPIEKKAAPARDRSLDQPKGAFDYVRKRNAVSRSFSGGR